MTDKKLEGLQKKYRQTMDKMVVQTVFGTQKSANKLKAEMKKIELEMKKLETSKEVTQDDSI
jgi:hypothetical protein